jgi:type IV pilus biogenesis protein CpaD/CtpE
MRMLSTWLLVPLAAAALLAGCGSSSSDSTSSSSRSTTTTTPTTSSAKSPAGASAVASCKRGAKAIPTLSSGTRDKIEAICDKAASGDPGATRVAAREVCEEIVKTSPLPEGAAKQHAIAGCKAAEKKK